jgi:hypothetical protein
MFNARLQVSNFEILTGVFKLIKVNRRVWFYNLLKRLNSTKLTA